MFQRALAIIFGLFWLILGASNFVDISFANEFFAAFESSTYQKLSTKVSGTDYMSTLIHVVEAAAGLCLIFGRFSALSLLVLLPITLNMTLYDFYVQPEELIISIAITAIHITLLMMYHRILSPLLRWDN